MSTVDEGKNEGYPSGLAVIPEDGFQDPGIPPHHPRKTDLDPRAERRAARQVAFFFGLSIVGSILAIWAYIALPITDDIGTVHPNNMWLGLGIALGMLGIGIGAVHWAKQLMPANEVSEERHSARSTDESREEALEIVENAKEESGIGRRTLIRRTLIGALAVTPLPGIVILRDLGPESAVEPLKHTMWEKGVRLARDPDGTPIKASEVTIGSAFHVIPETLKREETEDFLEEKAKAAVLMVRMEPESIKESEERKSWSYNGIVAYSKICTHVGCPVALVEQHTHHLLCPCHQSTFDISDECKVVFGPAKRPLPQLPISVDEEGYLIATSDFHEPVGPSFFERARDLDESGEH